MRSVLCGVLVFILAGMASCAVPSSEVLSHLAAALRGKAPLGTKTPLAPPPGSSTGAVPYFIPEIQQIHHKFESHLNDHFAGFLVPLFNFNHYYQYLNKPHPDKHDRPRPIQKPGVVVHEEHKYPTKQCVIVSPLPGAVVPAAAAPAPPAPPAPPAKPVVTSKPNSANSAAGIPAHWYPLYLPSPNAVRPSGKHQNKMEHQENQEVDESQGDEDTIMVEAASRTGNSLKNLEIEHDLQEHTLEHPGNLDEDTHPSFPMRRGVRGKGRVLNPPLVPTTATPATAATPVSNP